MYAAFVPSASPGASLYLPRLPPSQSLTSTQSIIISVSEGVGVGVGVGVGSFSGHSRQFAEFVTCGGRPEAAQKVNSPPIQFTTSAVKQRS